MGLKNFKINGKCKIAHYLWIVQFDIIFSDFWYRNFWQIEGWLIYNWVYIDKSQNWLLLYRWKHRIEPRLTLNQMTGFYACPLRKH